MSARIRIPPFLRRQLVRWLARPAAPPAAPRRRRVCIYKVDHLGDFVLALGAIRQLVAHYGAGECRLIVSTTAEPIAAAEFPDVARWAIPAGSDGVWRGLRPLRHRTAHLWATEEYEALVCLRHTRNSHRDVALSWLTARHWHGIGDRPAAPHLATEAWPGLVAGYPSHAAPPWCRELLAHRAVIAAATGKEHDWAGLRPEFRRVRSNPGSAWVFCPFGSAAIRDYPADLWAAAWRAAALPPAPLQLLGPAERAADLAGLAARLRRDTGHPAITVETALPTMEFVRRIAAARGVVTVDSAAAHLATAFDRPAVVVAGGGHFGWFSSWGDGVRQRWVAQEMECFGCNWVCRYPTIRCLAELPAEKVAAALRSLLADA